MQIDQTNNFFDIPKEDSFMSLTDSDQEVDVDILSEDNDERFLTADKIGLVFLELIVLLNEQRVSYSSWKSRWHWSCS